METNRLYHEDCRDTMAKMPSNLIDLVITSPPYDNLRTYKDTCSWNFSIFQEIAIELFRVVAKGGVVVWVVGDATIEGSETGTSFKQALYFKEIGFRLHDTMIYQKDSIVFPEVNRYSQIFEYMFIFSKGKPKVVNIIKDRKNLHYGTKRIKGGERQVDGRIIKRRKGNLLKEFGARFNIWRISGGANKSTKDDFVSDHPAIFPEKLAKDHILSWSNEGDLIYDPFGGSGTVAKMAILNKRRWMASELVESYCGIHKKRTDLANMIMMQQTLF